MSLDSQGLSLKSTLASSPNVHLEASDSALKRSQSPVFIANNTYILQQVPDASDSQTRNELTSKSSHVSWARLTTDEGVADYYIISNTDIIDETQPDETQCNTLLALFSRPTDDEHPYRRYLRCANPQLRDFRAWFSEQEENPIFVPSSFSYLGAESTQSFTDEERERCQKQLMSTFQQSLPPNQRRLALMALYCAANSMRDLSRPELVAFVKIGMQITSRTVEFTHDSDQLAELVDSSINSLSPIVCLQSSGTMVFKDALMKNFIRQLKLPDVQAGHLTMTRICFEQVRRFGAALIIQPWYHFRSWFGSLSEWPLVGYVVRNWFLHYRLTSNRPDRAHLDSEFYQMLREALLAQGSQQPSMLLERRIVDAGYTLSQIYCLPGLEAVFRNMGARTTLATNSVLGRVPTMSQWQRMRYKGPLTSTSDFYQTWMQDHSAADECRIVTNEDDLCGAIVVQLCLSAEERPSDDRETDTNGSASTLSETYVESSSVDEPISESDWIHVADTEMMDESQK